MDNNLIMRLVDGETPTDREIADELQRICASDLVDEEN
jgi:hypothetical protein